MITFNPKAKSFGDCLGPAMKISEPEEATDFFRAYVEHIVESGRNRPDAIRIALENIRYFAGYHDEETRNRISKLFPHRIADDLNVQEAEFIKF